MARSEQPAWLSQGKERAELTLTHPPPGALTGGRQPHLEASQFVTGTEGPRSSTATGQSITVWITPSREEAAFVSARHKPGAAVAAGGARRGAERCGPVCAAADRAQLAQDCLCSACRWLFSARSAEPPSDLASAVREARLEAEPEKLPLFLPSAAAPCSLRPALRRRAAPVALLTLPGLTSSP